VTFVDTSAIYALADVQDPRHAEAREILRSLLAEGQELLTHNYVLVESLALVQHRLGSAPAVKLARSAAGFEIVWVDETLHGRAVRELERAGRRASFVDVVSFLVMKEKGVRAAFAFDPDFSRRGFRLVGQ